MSSPIAKNQKSAGDLALIAAHQRLSHGTRIEILAREISARLKELPPTEGALRVLDIGCGDMTLADAVVLHVGDIDVRCADIHPCSDQMKVSDQRWNRYTQFDGATLPFANHEFDVAILSDVLHHVPEHLRVSLLRSAVRVAKHVVIKDHFETGWFSRQTLRAMDFVGNFGYGVSVPDRYFDQMSFMELCRSADVTIERMDVGLQLYGHLPVLRDVLSSDWHFFCVCKAALPQ